MLSHPIEDIKLHEILGPFNKSQKIIIKSVNCRFNDNDVRPMSRNLLWNESIDGVLTYAVTIAVICWKQNHQISFNTNPVDKNRSTTGGQSWLSYLQQWPQQEDSPDHASWETINIYKLDQFGMYCRVPARWGLQQTHTGIQAATRHGVRDPLVR